MKNKLLTFFDRILVALLSLMGLTTFSCGAYGCPPDFDRPAIEKYRVSGKVLTKDAVRVENIEVKVDCGGVVAMDTTDKMGLYEIEIEAPYSKTVSLYVRDLDGETYGQFLPDTINLSTMTNQYKVTWDSEGCIIKHNIILTPAPTDEPNNEE